MPLRHRPHALLLLLPLATWPAQASAQRNPGAPGSDGVSASTFRSEYFAAVVPQVNDLMADWSRAWSSDDVDALVRLYTEDAVLLPAEGAAVVGRSALAEHFRTALPESGAMEAFMQAFDGSGAMSFVYGTFLGSGPEGTISGELVTVFARRGRDWLIRAQTFRPGKR